MREPRWACLRSGPEHAHSLGEGANRDHGSDSRDDAFLAVGVTRTVRCEEESSGKHEIAAVGTIGSVSTAWMIRGGGQ